MAVINTIRQSMLRVNPFLTAFEKSLFKILQFIPGKTAIYKIAFQHSSIKKNIEDNNERLEFLGDAVLDTIIASYLYKKYPFKNEGFLTEMKSKIVNRQVLNNVAKKLGLDVLLQTNIPTENYNPHLLGNSLEALIAAIYLDKGFEKTYQWVATRMILPHIFLDQIEATEANIKNKLFQWATKQQKTLDFRLIETSLNARQKTIFHIGIFIDETLLVSATGLKKKEAEQNVALLAFAQLGLK